MDLNRWDYDTHPGDCHPTREGGFWWVCCRECAGTGVFPVPWIRSPIEGTARFLAGCEDATCVQCKATGRHPVTLAAGEK